MTIKVVFSNANGFVTDYGAPVVVLTDRNEREIIPRYGIWQKNVRGKDVVVKVTASLEEAKRFLDGKEIGSETGGADRKKERI